MKITTFLVILQIIVFFFTLENLEYYIENFGFNLEKFLRGEYYRIVTSIFLHGSFYHLIFNLLALFLIGRSVESSEGKMKLIFVFMISGILANFGMVFYPSNSVGIGSSGAISGLIGYAIFSSPFKIVFVPIPLPLILISASFLLSTVSNLFTESSIGYFAHLVGFLVGSFIGFLIHKSKRKNILIFILILALILIISNLNLFL